MSFQEITIIWQMLVELVKTMAVSISKEAKETELLLAETSLQILDSIELVMKHQVYLSKVLWFKILVISRKVIENSLFLFRAFPRLRCNTRGTSVRQLHLHSAALACEFVRQ